jgi:DNA-3-methyladenine glycosylase II
VTLGRTTLLSAVGRLARRDRRLGALVRRHGPPPLWARPRGFPTLLRIILEQQVSLASAHAMYLRLAAAVPGVTPAAVLALGAAGLQGIGFTRQKAGYACALAGRVMTGRSARAAGRLPDDEARALLMQVPGIGPWSASIYLLMALRRPDVWPPGDLALHKALARVVDCGRCRRRQRPGGRAAVAPLSRRGRADPVACLLVGESSLGVHPAIRVTTRSINADRARRPARAAPAR